MVTVKAGTRPPWVGLGAAVWVQIAAGNAYTFPLYSHSLKSVLGFNQRQLTMLGVANDIGENVGLIPGIASNKLPPWLILLIGALACFSGYGVLWLVVSRTLDPLPYWLLWIALCVATNSNAWFTTAVLVTNMRNFPLSRGMVAGILKGYGGLSAAVFTEIYSVLLRNSSSKLLLFLVLGIPILCFIMMYFVRPCTPASSEDPAERGHFLFIQVASVVLGLYVLTTTVLDDVLTLSATVTNTFVVIMVLLLMAPLAIPVKMTLYPTRASKSGTIGQTVGSSDSLNHAEGLDNGEGNADKTEPPISLNDAVIPQYPMAWFRSLIQVSATARSATKPRILDPFSYTPLSRFSSEPAPIHETPAPSPAPQTPTQYSGLGPTKPGEKPRVVVLGTGWAGCRLMKGLDTDIYDVVCVSPRNHMVFTPLLASTCVGTLEFRSVAEPIGRIQPAISREPGSYFFLSNCVGLDPDKHLVQCETVTDGAEPLKPWKFEISYDKLVIALGAKPTTFGIQGVEEHAIFLREVYHAQEIRRKLLLNLMLSDVPGVSEEEKSRLLHCVVVGGGPTGVEFSGELSDFIQRDVRQRYSHVKNYIHVTLIEANEILSSFDDRLRHYATKQLTKSGVRLVRGIVKDVKAQKIILNDGTEVPYGLLVWSTGVGPSPLVNSLPLPKAPGGRVGVDEWLRVPSVQDVYSIGDCSGFVESTGKPTLPALAQVAERQGKYLANLLNTIGKAGGGRANGAKEYKFEDPFVYKHLGSMATLGRYKALVDLRQSKDGKGLALAGFTSWFIWRSAYLTRVLSWRNRFYVAINWATTFVFGRDITRI